MLLLSLFVWRLGGDREVAVLASLFSISWYGLYRLVSNYHANMLALILIFAAVFVLLKYNSYRGRCLSYFLMFLASITHPITSVFTVIFVSALFLLFLFERERRYVIDSIIVFLSSILSFSFLLGRTKSVLGVIVHSEVFEYNVFHRTLVSMGVFLPITILGFLVLVSVGIRGKRGNARGFALFVVCWSAVSMVASVLFTFFPRFAEFERIMILAPTPILLAEGYFLVQTLRKILSSHISLVYLLSGIMIAVVLSSTFLVYAEASVEFQAFASYSGYQKLQWIVENMDDDMLVFIIYGGGTDSMLVGEVYNYLITAAVGDHYTFLGRVDFFLSFLRMPFLNSRGERYSRMFFKGLKDSGLLDWDVLREYKIIVIDDFYLPHGLPSYYKDLLFDEVYDGVYLWLEAKGDYVLLMLLTRKRDNNRLKCI